MVLVPHLAFIIRIFKRVFLYVCCILLLSLLLHEKQQRTARVRDDEGRPWIGKTYEVEEKYASRSADKFKETVTRDFSLEFPQNFSMQSSGTFPLHITKPENITSGTGPLSNAQEINPLWMRITDDLYTYSAFWDDRQSLPTGAAVRVLGILRYQELLHDIKYQWSGEIRKDALNYSCYLWYKGQNSEKGELSAFIYEEGLKVFVGTYFLCSPLRSTNNSSNTKSSQSRVPYAVSLVPNGTDNTFLKLIYLTSVKESGQVNRNQSGVCVRALFGPYSDLAAITLFISYYNTVFNISHFYFYDFAISKAVREFLMLLMAKGEVSIHLLPWNIPFSELEMIWDLGSLTSTNDCIYRTSNQLSYVAIVDLDEFIVPRTPVTTLGELYTNVIRHKRGQKGDAVLTLNAFFCSEFQEKNKTGRSDDFNIFRAPFREARLWPSKTRSKLIVVPQTVVSMGHHMVHVFLKPDLKNQASPKSHCVLHHYRKCGGLRMGIHATGRDVLKQKPVRDISIMKYKKIVLSSRTFGQYLSFTKKIL